MLQGPMCATLRVCVYRAVKHGTDSKKSNARFSSRLFSLLIKVKLQTAILCPWTQRVKFQTVKTKSPSTSHAVEVHVTQLFLHVNTV